MKALRVGITLVVSCAALVGAFTDAHPFGQVAGPISERALLAPEDFRYAGYYDMQTEGNNSVWVKGFTHRYVGRDLRFLVSGSGNWVVEFSIAGKAFGDIVTERSNIWEPAWTEAAYAAAYPSEALGWSHALWWDEAGQRLWTLSAPGYTAVQYPVKIFTRTLNADGSIANLRGVGVRGQGAKRIFGGAQAIPTWFQQKYGVGPFVVGWGGYQSLMAQGTHVSLGPAFYAVADPGSVANGAELPAKALADNSSGTGRGDWYRSRRPSSFDRGIRLTNPTNEFDEGGWQSPAPDGRGRWTWGDSYYNTGTWIDGPTKHGFIAIASLCGGRCWYQNSTLNSERRHFELHIYDPANLGEVATGKRQIWDARPARMAELKFPGLGQATQGNGEFYNIAGATYDAKSKRLFVLGPGGGGEFVTRLYVFEVND
jgi:hypothetical protein